MSRDRFEPPGINRRGLIAGGAGLLYGLIAWPSARAETYLTVEQAQRLMFPGQTLARVPVVLDAAQRKRITKASRERVRNAVLRVWKSDAGEWFIFDTVIGKHENIDLAVALDAQGQVTGIEILTYRESYGFEVRNAKWRAQFHGRDHSRLLKLDDPIRNISGATLSCRHITDGVNRLTHTWNEVLRTL